ncbi:hypothetical protein N185_34525 [Sinorhizobium sp. GW3]|nr:hypothetical protein N185_34525 [Sinorhizobium sp. GW3]
MKAADENATLYQKEYSAEFASNFDEIVGWRDREEHERARLVSLLRSYGARRILDAACGTGFHLSLLSQADFDLVGTDGSEAMVAKAKMNLSERGMSVPLHVCDWQELTQCNLGLFDAVLCLGDSFAHLLNVEQQLVALQQFFELLIPGGVLVLDHRNYDRIVAMGSYVEQPTGYCCCGDTPPRELTVEADGLVTCRYRGGKGTEFVFRTFPVSKIGLANSLKKVGFGDVQILNGSPGGASPHSSEIDFVLEVATKAVSSTR